MSFSLNFLHLIWWKLHFFLLAFLLGFFGFDGICFRGIEPEEDFPGMSTVSNTEFSAALAKVLVAKGSCRS